MKTTFLATALSLLATASIQAATATKELPASEVWQGDGQEYSPSGTPLNSYTITVKNTFIAQDKMQSESTMTFENGNQTHVSQTIEISGNSWSVVSNLGKGGGTCYGQDVCENYLEGSDGKSYATTIIKDESGQRRNVTFALKNGKALKVYRDHLTRVP